MLNKTASMFLILCFLCPFLVRATDFSVDPFSGKAWTYIKTSKPKSFFAAQKICSSLQLADRDWVIPSVQDYLLAMNPENTDDLMNLNFTDLELGLNRSSWAQDESGLACFVPSGWMSFCNDRKLGVVCVGYP